MKFSQRIGEVQVSKQMQIESMDDDLRNSLWNGINLFVLEKLNKYDGYPYTPFTLFARSLWHHFFKLPVDNIPSHFDSTIIQIRDYFFIKEWYNVYDFIEFVANLNPNSIPIDVKAFKLFCNGIFEKEFSGYRFIDDKIVPITNKTEIAEIESALNYSSHLSGLQGANIHLHSALDKISSKTSPDYRNSIKESISAVESIAKVISGNNKDTLSGSLDKIKGKIKIHPLLEKGFKSIYGYTSDSSGIRHGLTEANDCSFEDAKFMVVASSAFINYLIAKADKAGVILDKQ